MALAAVVWAASCSGSQVPSVEEAGAGPDLASLEQDCRDSFPELPRCRAFLVQGVREDRVSEIGEGIGRLGREHPDHWAVAYMTGYLHYLSQGEADEESAVDAFQEAERLAAKVGSREGQAEALLMSGAMAEFRDGDIDRALDLYLESAGHADAGDDYRLYVQAAWAVATVYREMGLYTDQIDWLNRALERLGEDRDPVRRRNLLYVLGNVHRILGDWNSSRRYLDEMLSSAIEDEDAGEEVYALQLIGVVELDRNPLAAIPWFERCAVRAAQAGFPAIQAHAEVLEGVALVQAGRLAEGRDALAAILDRSMQYAEDDIEMRVQGLANLLFLAEAERRLGHEDQALTHYERTRTKAEEWRDPYFQWQVSAGLAELHLEEERWDLAATEARRGVREVESVRADLREEGQRLYYLRKRSAVYATLASALEYNRPGELDESFTLIEEVHARTLRESLHGRSDDEPVELTVSLATVRSRLTADDLLLEYLLGEEESLLLVATRDSARLHRLPGREELEQAVERYRQVLSRPLASLQARLDPEADFRRTGSPGFELYRLLLGPASSEVAAADRLIIVPDKQLHRLPFAALPTKDPGGGGALRFLAESHSVVYLPAASFLAKPRRSGGEEIVIVAAGEGRPALGLAELTQVPLEVDGIRASYPGEERIQILQAGDATPAGLAAALDDDVRALHVIGHAVLDPSSGPEIVLAGSKPDGYALLTADEIIAMAPTPPLVVLSACWTAEGELVGGEGILGLVRAFQLSESSQTVASLWQADDAITAKLMAGFHAGLQGGLPPSAALAASRRAQLADGFVHPFGWAGFVLYGSD